MLRKHLTSGPACATCQHRISPRSRSGIGIHLRYSGRHCLRELSFGHPLLPLATRIDRECLTQHPRAFPAASATSSAVPGLVMDPLADTRSFRSLPTALRYRHCFVHHRPSPHSCREASATSSRSFDLGPVFSFLKPFHAE